MSDNPRFDAYLESLGIAQGGTFTYRRRMIAAMFHTAGIYLNGYGMPIFPVAKLKGGWIGWLCDEPDMQASEGWPFSSLTTRHVVREWQRMRRRKDHPYMMHLHSDAVEVALPLRFDYIAGTLRFLHRYRGEERRMIIAGFCQAIGRPRSDHLNSQLEYADQLFTQRVKSADFQKHRGWRKLAKELNL